MTIDYLCPICKKLTTLQVSEWEHHLWIFWPLNFNSCCKQLVTYLDPEDIKSNQTLRTRIETNKLVKKYKRRLNKEIK